MWNAITGLQDGAPMKHNSYLTDANFSNDGKWIVTFRLGYDNKMWDAITKKQLTSFTTNSVVNSVVFSPDKKGILIATSDSNAYLLNIPGDLDMPGIFIKLQAQVITGLKYNIVTNETECLSPDEWNKTQ